MPENERTKGVSTLTGAAHLPQKNGTSAVFPGTVGGTKEVVFPKVRSHLENCNSLFLRILRLLGLTASLRTATARNPKKMVLFFEKARSTQTLASQIRAKTLRPNTGLSSKWDGDFRDTFVNIEILPNTGLSKNSEILPSTGLQAASCN